MRLDAARLFFGPAGDGLRVISFPACAIFGAAAGNRQCAAIRAGLSRSSLSSPNSPAHRADAPCCGLSGRLGSCNPNRANGCRSHRTTLTTILSPFARNLRQKRRLSTRLAPMREARRRAPSAENDIIPGITWRMCMSVSRPMTPAVVSIMSIALSSMSPETASPSSTIVASRSALAASFPIEPCRTSRFTWAAL